MNNLITKYFKTLGYYPALWVVSETSPYFELKRCLCQFLVAQDCHHPGDWWFPGEEAWWCRGSLHCPAHAWLPGKWSNCLKHLLFLFVFSQWEISRTNARCELHSSLPSSSWTHGSLVCWVSTPRPGLSSFRPFGSMWRPTNSRTHMSVSSSTVTSICSRWVESFQMFVKTYIKPDIFSTFSTTKESC